MSTSILSTCGTSLIGNYRRSKGMKNDEMPDYRQVVEEIDSKNIDDSFCGAELNTIASLFKTNKVANKNLTPPFNLHFLVSGTEDGELTGKVLKEYLSGKKDALGLGDIDYEIIEDLQSGDRKKFANRGLRNLLRKACRYLDNRKEDLRIINATGGYKAQISFAGLIGQTLNIPVIYLFEKFDGFIEMPPMPVDFSRDLWLEHYTLFEMLSKEDCELNNAQLRDSDPRIVNLLDSEVIDGKRLYALSPVLELMHLGFQISPWPSEVKSPERRSTKTIQQKWAVNEAELPHSPTGTESFLKKLVELYWVESVSTIKFENTARSFVKSKKDPDQPNEIQLVHSDGTKGVTIALKTTCMNDGERIWCIDDLNKKMIER